MVTIAMSTAIESKSDTATPGGAQDQVVARDLGEDGDQHEADDPRAPVEAAQHGEAGAQPATPVAGSAHSARAERRR